MDSVSHHGGVGCTNTTAVFVEGDPGPLAEALAQRLGAIPSLPPENEKAILPVHPLKTAETLDNTCAWLGGNGVADDLRDGTAALRPAVHQLDSPRLGPIRQAPRCSRTASS